MRFKTLRESPKGKAQRGQYLLAVGLGCYRKPLPSRCVLKTLRGNPKRTISASGGLEPLQVHSKGCDPYLLTINFGDFFKKFDLYQTSILLILSFSCLCRAKLILMTKIAGNIFSRSTGQR